MRLARRYNGTTTVLLTERLFTDQYVTIASSSFDDTVEYSVEEDALTASENPSLTTEQFHEIFRQLTPSDQLRAKKGRVF